MGYFENLWAIFTLKDIVKRLLCDVINIVPMYSSESQELYQRKLTWPKFCYLHGWKRRGESLCILLHYAYTFSSKLELFELYNVMEIYWESYSSFAYSIILIYSNSNFKIKSFFQTHHRRYNLLYNLLLKNRILILKIEVYVYYVSTTRHTLNI